MLQQRLGAICDGYIPKGCVFLKTANDLGMDSIDVCDKRQRAWIVEYALARELRLLVIDPFAFLHRLDEKETRHAVEIGDALKGIARETGAALVILNHFRKSLGNGSEDVLQALRGAIAKSAFASTVAGMDTYQGTVRLRFGKVAASSLPDPVYLNRDPMTGVLRVTDAPMDQRDAKVERLEKLRALVADGQPHTAEEMGDEVGVKPDTVRKRYVPELGMVKVNGSKNAAYRLADNGTRPEAVREPGQLSINP